MKSLKRIMMNIKAILIPFFLITLPWGCTHFPSQNLKTGDSQNKVNCDLVMPEQIQQEGQSELALGKKEKCLGNKMGAMDFFNKACLKGQGEACALLGYMHDEKGNVPMARHFYTKGCELQNQDACHNKATLSSEKNQYLEKAARHFDRYSGQIQNCYMSSRAQDPSFARSESKMEVVIVDFRISPQGKAEAIKINSRVVESHFQDCVLQIMEKIQFPNPPKNLIPSLSQQYQFHIK